MEDTSKDGTLLTRVLSAKYYPFARKNIQLQQRIIVKLELKFAIE